MLVKHAMQYVTVYQSKYITSNRTNNKSHPKVLINRPTAMPPKGTGHSNHQMHRMQDIARVISHIASQPYQSSP
jgi:hypothetical protein